MQREVCRFANVLESNGVKSKDRVLIYMPMVAEASIAMLACARIGAVHSIVFGGFSAESIKDRLDDSKATCVITADGGWRRGGIIDLKANVDEALKKDKTVNTVIVLKRTENKVKMKRNRDVWWHEEAAKVPATHKAKFFDSEHPLFILYTSGSTGNPKVFCTRTGGYMINTYATCKYIFDMRDDDVYWCTADVWLDYRSFLYHLRTDA